MKVNLNNLSGARIFRAPDTGSHLTWRNSHVDFKHCLLNFENSRLHILGQRWRWQTSGWSISLQYTSSSRLVKKHEFKAMRESKFQVLVPRLKDEPHAYTRYFNAPMQVKHLFQIGPKFVLISGECWYHTWRSCWSRKLRGCRSQV